MIDIGHRRPHIGIVAVLTNIGRLYVQRAFAGCIRTVVTAYAVVHDIGMVKIRRNPGHACVAVIAVIAA